MSTSYRITLRCTDCGHKWRRQTQHVMAEDPPCPACAKVPKNIGLDVAAGVAPAIGGNPAVKAMDYTMETVAQDYGFTNLRTDAHEGESMVPKLPPAQQQMADAMFNPQARRQAMRGRMAPKLNGIAAAAMAGEYRAPAHDPIAALHAGRPRGSAPVKVNYVNPER